MKKLLLTVTSFIYLNSFSQAPTIQWQQMLAGTSFEMPLSTIETHDGGFISVGYTYSHDLDFVNSDNSANGWITKLNSNGNIIWKKLIGGTMFDGLSHIVETHDGEYVVVGNSNSHDGDILTIPSGNHFDIIVLKLDSSGNILWQKSIGGSGIDYPSSIVATTDNGFIIAGESSSNDGDISFNHNNGNFTSIDCWLVKIDANGTILWDHSYGGSGYDVTRAICSTSDGGYVIAAHSDSYNGDVSHHVGNINNRNCWVFKIDSTGLIQWEKSYSKSDFYEPRDITRTTDNGFIIVGQTGFNVSADSLQGMIIKLDHLGQNQWEHTYGGSGFESLASIEESTPGNFLIGGTTSSSDGGIINNHGVEECWIFETDSTGNFIWQETYGGSKRDYTQSIIKTSDGGILLSSYTESDDYDIAFNPTPSEDGNVWLVKLNGSVTNINKYNKNSECIFHPNPAKDLITIDLKNRTTDTQYQITNSIGQSMLSGTLEQEKSTINISELSSGVYILQIGDEQKQSYKLIKE